MKFWIYSQEPRNGHANEPFRDGNVLYLLDFSRYLMADKKYIGEEVNIIVLLPWEKNKSI